MAVPQAAGRGSSVKAALGTVRGGRTTWLHHSGEGVPGQEQPEQILEAVDPRTWAHLQCRGSRWRIVRGREIVTLLT